MNDSIPVFPCETVPSVPEEWKLLGLYQQLQDGLWMQRIKILGGMLTAEQWAALAEMCRRYTPFAPLHLTTRQDIEFHNVTQPAIPLLQKAVAEAGLSGHGACGDTLRNLTVCPGSGLCEDSPDLSGIAWTLRTMLESYPRIYSLPRKFKISLSACSKACAQPWINDLGFVFNANGTNLSVTAIGAGSLGPRPGTGVLLRERIQAEEVLALSLAAVRVFDTHGDRQNRSRARLRHARERIGNAQFLEMIETEFASCRKEKLPCALEIPIADGSFAHVADLAVPFGALAPEQADEIATLMRTKNIMVRLQNHHRLCVFANDRESAFNAITASAHLRSLLNGPDIVSCPGTTYCSRGIVNTHVAERLLRDTGNNTKSSAIRISGCPNMCCQSAVADIGLVGRIKKDRSGNRTEGYLMLTCGGMGKSPTLAVKSHDFIPATKLTEVIKVLKADS